VIYDDARHFIATTDEKFDIIATDPIHPWMDGSATLFSIEYYALARERLNDGGFIAQWVPTYDTDEATVKSQVGTFMQVFPDGTLWSNHIPGEGLSFIMLGHIGTLEVDANRLASRIEGNPSLGESLADVDIESIVRLLAAYVSQGPDLAEWLEDAQINRERSLRLQYLAGLSMDFEEEAEIYRAVAQYRGYPDNIFIVPYWVESRLKGMWR
jgi:spermidine synthase